MSTLLSEAAALEAEIMDRLGKFRRAKCSDDFPMSELEEFSEILARAHSAGVRLSALILHTHAVLTALMPEDSENLPTHPTNYFEEIRSQGHILLLQAELEMEQK